MLDFLAAIGTSLVAPLATPRGLAISVASVLGLSLVVAASFARTMVRLRALTVLSNLFLLTAAALAPNLASILMFLILIPLNSYRLVEIIRLTRKVEEAAGSGDLTGLWLKPYMKSNRFAAGTVLFRKGDAADSLYLLVEGDLQLVEIAKAQPRGELFGEISFFSPERKRTLTARCLTDCEVLSISEPTFKQLYFQSPKFAFHVSELITRRLGADIERLRQALAAGAPAEPLPAVDMRHARVDSASV